MTDLAKDLKELMDGWNKIQQAAKEQFPNASKEELYQISKGAMEYALGMSKAA